MITALNHLGEAALRFAWPMLWQSSLLITVLFALDFALRRKVRAAVRYALWLVVLLKLLVPPSLAFPTGLAWWVRPAAPSPQVFQAKQFVVTYSPALIPPPENLPVFQPPPPPVPRLSAAAAALLASIVISLGLFAWMLWRWRQVVRHIRKTEAPPDWLNDLLAATKRQAGLRGRIRLQLTDQAISPAVCGLFRPLVMLPASLAEQLSRPQLRAILLHELVHLHRADVWLNCAQALLQIAYWWHPLLWLANARIRRLREEAVDDAVMLSLRDEAEIYAPTLLEVAKLAFHRPLASLGLVGILESKRALRQRIERLLDFQPPRRAGLTIVSMLGILAFTGLAVPQGEAPPKPAKAAADAENGVVVVDANSATLDTKIEEAQVEHRQGFLAQPPISPDSKTAVPDPPVRAEPKAKAAALVQEAAVLFELHKLDEADAKLKDALKLDRANWRGWYYRNLIKDARYFEAQVNSGSPAGSNGFARRIPVNTSKGRQAIFQKLDRIRLDGVRFDNVPLSEVVRSLSVECKKQDEDKIGLNFILSPNINAIVEIMIDPATGLPRVPAPPLPEVPDIGTIQVKLAPALNNVRLMEVLDIIVKVADQPPGTFGIKYSIEDYGVLFSWKPRETVELMLRTFRVDPNTFIQRLESATGFAVGTGMRNPPDADSNGGQSRYYHDPNNPPGVISLARTNDTTAVAGALRAFFQSRGANLDPPKSVFWDNRTGTLLVNATMKDLDVIERVVQTLTIQSQKGSNSDRNADTISPKSGDALPLISRTFRVDRITFLQGLERAVGAAPGTILSTNYVPVSEREPAWDPSVHYVTRTNNAAGTSAALLLYFKSRGIDFTPPKSIFWSDGQGRLLVKATHQDLETIESAIAALNTAPPQITIKARFIEIPTKASATFWKSIGITNAASKPESIILTSTQAADVLKALESQKDTDILSQSGVITLSGRQTQIQVTDTQTVVTQVTNGLKAPEFITENIPFGPILDLIPNIVADGRTIELTTIATLNAFLGYDEPPKKEWAEVLVAGKPTRVKTPLPRFRSTTMTTKTRIGDGQTLVLGNPDVVEISSNRVVKPNPKSKSVEKTLLVFVTPRLVDAAGNPYYAEAQLPISKPK